MLSPPQSLDDFLLGITALSGAQIAALLYHTLKCDDRSCVVLGFQAMRHCSGEFWAGEFPHVALGSLHQRRQLYLNMGPVAGILASSPEWPLELVPRITAMFVRAQAEATPIATTQDVKQLSNSLHNLLELCDHNKDLSARIYARKQSFVFHVLALAYVIDASNGISQVTGLERNDLVDLLARCFEVLTHGLSIGRSIRGNVLTTIRQHPYCNRLRFYTQGQISLPESSLDNYSFRHQLERLIKTYNRDESHDKYPRIPYCLLPDGLCRRAGERLCAPDAPHVYANGAEWSSTPLSPSLLLCARCRLVRYCSASCQRADWPSHRLLCGADAAAFVNNLRKKEGLLDTVVAPCGVRGLELAADAEVSSERPS
ncbi:hypothetical protein M427DRAFT_60531 [Gonapodya prolifera JEL478]|uniref:MYND-type domain-containing protein n=1 Tax=Gonapodya prolifera (strain JEL478) TaxID=1344416 RepID=A0A139A3Y4_GONPJ|nr:hypothetical protein M427DRAFT_60531 [Gonapodya prolifera JEL478]|eukprot:KXS11500.1 hypothetical protein M427DRAFT_60531 [Gonapodya prolifera JEL478]